MSCVTEESDTDFGLCSRAYLNLKIVFLALADSASDKNATNLCVILLRAATKYGTTQPLGACWALIIVLVL